MEESGASFDNRPNFMVSEDHINKENLFTSFSTSPHCTTMPHFTTVDSATAYSASAPTAAPSVATSTVSPASVVAASVALPSAAATSVVAGSATAIDDIDVGPAGSDFSEEEVEGSNYSTEDSVESEGELAGDNDNEENGSDVHEEVRDLRAEKRKFQRRKIKERAPADNAEVPVGKAGPDLGFDDTEIGKAGPDLGFDDTEIGKVSYERRLGGDEPYFACSDEGSFDLEEDDCCGDEEHDVLASGCPHRAPSAELTAPVVATDTSSGKGRGRPKKAPPEAPNVAPQGKSNGSDRGRGRPKKNSSEAITEPPQGKKGEGRPKRTISVGATATPLPTAPLVPTIFLAYYSTPTDFCTSSSIAGTTKRGMGSGRGNTTLFKRQRVVGMGVFQSENGFKVLNPGIPSSKIYSTGQAKVARSTDVTGDIGYTPSSISKLK
ncbi:hypothetical protein FXO37_12578 [Capsicum annuum]|nr:hypothetical protein FXO37_12578 [Capsicum annuum]